jgi:hypothetical protein
MAPDGAHYAACSDGVSRGSSESLARLVGNRKGARRCHVRKVSPIVIGFLLVLAVACAGDGDGRSSSPESPTIPLDVKITGRELPLDFSSTPLPGDGAGRWQVMTVQGVQVEIPYGTPWIVAIQDDPCFGDHRRLIILQNEATGDRLKVDMTKKTVTAVFQGPPQRLDRIINRIQKSFVGERQIPPELEAVATLPHPTSPACDPSVEVPTLVPEPAPVTTVPPEPTSARERPTEGTEVPSGPEPGEPD